MTDVKDYDDMAGRPERNLSDTRDMREIAERLGMPPTWLASAFALKHMAHAMGRLLDRIEALEKQRRG